MAKTLSLSLCEKPPQVYDLTRQRFNRLTVLKFIGIDISKNKYWECLCDCGNTKTIAAKHFTTGKTQSCGCFQASDASQRALTHGESSSTGDTSEYHIYCTAKQRCHNPNNHAYNRYGGRGIEFRFNSYEEFLAYLGRRPSLQHSLDRIDNDGHYEIGNVRWATNGEQSRNTRVNRWLTAHGITKCLSDWSATLGMSESSVRERVENGWCEECAVTIKAHKGKCIHR